MLSDVSALSGYCKALHHQHQLIFSILMNGTYVPASRSLQDRMADLLVARG